MMSSWLMALACTPHAPVRADYAPALGGLTGEVVREGPLPARLARDDEADFVLLYGGEEQGSLEPCGCPHRPRGGVARQAAYAEAVRRADPTVALAAVNGGHWLDDATDIDGEWRPVVPVSNRWMVAGLEALGLAALNVGYDDMAGLTSLGDDDPPRLPLVSANVAGTGIAPYRVVTLTTGDGPMRVGITGLTTAGGTSLPTPGFVVSDPVRSGRAVLADLGPRVDLVVLLVNGAPEAARSLALDPSVGQWLDIVIDTNLHHAEDPPFRVGSAVWVRAQRQTMRLGELRLGLDRAPEEEGGEVRISWARDRKIDLDEDIPDALPIAAIAAAARVAIDAAQAQADDPRR